jgi:ABC-type Na+ efflux pump permease subunit
MILHIATKEIYHNLTTLRFALMIILLPVLFVANALIYSLGDNGYTTQINAYNEQVRQNRNHIKAQANMSLAELALRDLGIFRNVPAV